MTGRGRLWTVATLLVALAVPNVFGALPEWLVGPAPVPAVQWLIFLLYFGLATATVVLVLRADGVTASDIGIRRPGWITVASGVALWAVGLVVLACNHGTTRWRRDLVANMIAHSLGILVAMFTIVP